MYLLIHTRIKVNPCQWKISLVAGLYRVSIISTIPSRLVKEPAIPYQEIRYRVRIFHISSSVRAFIIVNYGLIDQYTFPDAEDRRIAFDYTSMLRESVEAVFNPQALHRPSHTRHSHHAGSGVGCHVYIRMYETLQRASRKFCEEQST